MTEPLNESELMERRRKSTKGQRNCSPKRKKAGQNAKPASSREGKQLPSIPPKSKRKKKDSKEMKFTEDFYLPRIQTVQNNQQPVNFDEVLRWVYEDLTNDIAKLECEQREQEILSFVKEREIIQNREKRTALIKNKTYYQSVKNEGKTKPLSKPYQFSYFPSTLPPIQNNEPRTGKKIPFGEMVDEEKLDPKRQETLKKMDSFAKRHYCKIPDIKR